MAAATELRGERALGIESRERLGVVQRGQRRATARVVGAALDADHALANGRQRQLEVELLGHVVRDAEALQSGAGQQDRVEFAFVEPAQARVDVAAQQLEAQVGPCLPQLGLSARAGGADPSALRQVGETPEAARDERIERVGARQHRDDGEARWQFARHVLHRVHRKVGAAFLHRDFEFLDEQALAADLGQRAIEHAVALRAHRHEFHGQARMCRAQQGLHVLGLPHGQLAAPGRDA
jgi:hypothetical protein